MDPATSFLLRHVVFVRNVKSSTIASQLKGLDSSFKFICKGPDLTDINEER